MPDIEAIDGVAAGDVEGVNGVAKANIQAINGVGIAASGATVWVMVQDDRNIAHAAASDLTSWTDYDAFAGTGASLYPSGSVDHIHLAYGKDGSGNPMWIGTYATNNCELAYTDDPTDGSVWTGIGKLADGSTDFPDRIYAIQWGNGVWIGVGQMNQDSVLRSTDGVAWSLVDVSGCTDFVSGGDSYGLASDGAGTWYFTQHNRIYRSTNDGAAWALHHTLLYEAHGDGNVDDAPGDIRALAFTNSTLVAITKTTGQVFSAAASDTTDWSAGAVLSSSANFGQQVRVAAGGGRVVMTYNQKKWTMDVSGKTITIDENNVDLSGDATTHGNATCAGTDGTTFVSGCLTGDVFSSTNGGDTWTAVATNVGSKDCIDVVPNVYLPV